MSLTRSLDIARSHLSATSEYMQTVSRNVARANDPTATRKTAQLVTMPNGGVRIGAITRSGDEMLTYKALVSTSDAARDKSIVAALDKLNETIGDPELEASPALLLQKFEQTLQYYSDNASDLARGQAAVRAARDLATGISSIARQTQLVREQADLELANTVGKVNTLLGQFETLNTDIVRGTIVGRDMTDVMDQRDAIVAQLAEEFGVRAEVRDGNDMALRTDSGVTLFDKTARTLTFQATGTFNGGTIGNAVLVDGVAITGSAAIMPVNSGRIAGLVHVRDVATTEFQAQLDEIARGLIEAFAEQDQSGGGGPPLAGLFTFSGGPVVPTSGVHVPGLAESFRVNPDIDPDFGGDVTLLRDGGVNGADYVYNTSGGAGYNSRILALGTAISTPRGFDGIAGLQTSANLLQFAASSDGWLAAERSAAQSSYDYTSVVYERASDALNKVTGINVQEEFLVMLELERSYQASSKLISAIDSMFDSLLGAVR